VNKAKELTLYACYFVGKYIIKFIATVLFLGSTNLKRQGYVFEIVPSTEMANSISTAYYQAH
jgi:hypothetical protein